MTTVYTFGDSILDCGSYNDHRVHPGQLIVQNHDHLFPEFRGHDMISRGPARLVHHARDGATIQSLSWQMRDLVFEDDAVALLTVGGNDLIGGLLEDDGSAIPLFAATLERLVRELPIRKIVLGNVYDPTFGDNARDFLGVDPRLGRENFRRVNDAIATVATRHGHLADLHQHFLTGDPSWYTEVIEPSLRGASEVRRVFLNEVLD